ncbi:Hypothetical_protein [Hexamita inflata]|uniref:Hypothetical_protein n=1 Tax=Hexamita inflata TaxID=28002 RepID=A0AA86TM34_9EUKA|nr:Hypothetical protein HINF_LOCUS7442 [Hexamita inflata]
MNVTLPPIQSPHLKCSCIPSFKKNSSVTSLDSQAFHTINSPQKKKAFQTSVFSGFLLLSAQIEEQNGILVQIKDQFKKIKSVYKQIDTNLERLEINQHRIFEGLKK